MLLTIVVSLMHVVVVLCLVTTKCLVIVDQKSVQGPSCYLNLCRAFLMYSSSSWNSCLLAQTVLALCVKVLKDIILQKDYSGCPNGGTGQYGSVSYTQNTQISNVSLGPGETKVSRNRMEPLLLEISVVNWICGSMELICMKCWLCSSC